MSVATLHSNPSPRMRTFNEVQQGIKHFFAAFSDSKKQRSASLSRASHGMEQYYTPPRLPSRPVGPPPPENLQRKQSTSKLTTVVSLATKSPERSSTSLVKSASAASTEAHQQSENLPKFDDTDLEGRGRAGTAEKKPPHPQEASLLSPSSSIENVQIPKHIHVLGIQGQMEGHSLLNPMASRIEEQSAKIKHSESELPQEHQEQSQQQTLTEQTKSEKQQQTQITTSIHIETRTTSMTPRVNEVSWIDSDVAMEVSVKVDQNPNSPGSVIAQVSTSSMVQSEATPLQSVSVGTLPESNNEVSPISSITRSLSAVSDGELIENENENDIKTTLNGTMEKSFVIQAPTDESDSDFHMAFVDNYLDQVVSIGSTDSSSTSISTVSSVPTQETLSTDIIISATPSSASSTSSIPPSTTSSRRRTSLFGYWTSNEENTPSSSLSSEKTSGMVHTSTSVPQDPVTIKETSNEEDDDDEFVIVDGAL